MNTIPKSLHTVSALVAVAQHLLATNRHPLTPDAALSGAAEILGYPAGNRTDPHGLYFIAQRKLAKGGK